MKIQTSEINNFKGLKKFKIENLPDFVVLTGESGAGKSSILRAITYLKENIIAPDRQPKTCTSSDSLCHELVNNNSSTCEISVKFELGQLEVKEEMKLMYQTIFQDIFVFLGSLL